MTVIRTQEGDSFYQRDFPEGIQPTGKGIIELIMTTKQSPSYQKLSLKALKAFLDKIMGIEEDDNNEEDEE